MSLRLELRTFEFGLLVVDHSRRFPERNCSDKNYVYEPCGSQGEKLGKNWAKFCGHFRASSVAQSYPLNFSPKFLPIYHSMSCGCKVKTSRRELLGFG